MKIVIVLLTHIGNLPPANTLISKLVEKNIEISLITMYSNDLPKNIKEAQNVTIYDLQENIEKNRLKCLFNRFSRRLKLRKLIKKIMNNQDILWTMTDYDAMEVGNLLLNYNHVMQLYELIDSIPFFDEIPFLKCNIKKYALNAKSVIVVEENRAFIQQAMWQLEELPFILPNRPELLNSRNNLEIDNIDAKRVLDSIKDKKIILYQGVFGYERVLDQFIEAVNKLGSAYCIVLMGAENEELRQLIKKYPYVYYIPFIKSPEHLQVTSHAHIGILSYVNTNKIKHYMPLNAIYCAPNKLYEYAAFGVPMIGNYIPGLNQPFSKYNIGLCAEELTSDSIYRAIKKIEENYDLMSNNCRKFYNDTNLDSTIDEILKKINVQE